MGDFDHLIPKPAPAGDFDHLIPPAPAAASALPPPQAPEPAPPGIAVNPPIPPAPQPAAEQRPQAPGTSGGIVGYLHDAGANIYDKFAHPASNYSVFSPEDIGKMSAVQKVVRPAVDFFGSTGQAFAGGLSQAGQGASDLIHPGRGGFWSTVRGLASQAVPGLGATMRFMGDEAPMPALDIAQGGLGAVFSPVTGLTQVIAGQPVESLTGSRLAGSTAGFLAQIPLSPRFGKAPVTAETAARLAEDARAGAPLAEPYHGPSDPFSATPPATAGLEAPPFMPGESGPPLRPASALERAAQANEGGLWALPQSVVERAALRDERVADAAASQRLLGKPLPGFALTDVGSTQTAVGASELPLIGTPIKRAIEEHSRALAEKGEEIASQFGDVRGGAGIGRTASEGMMRFAEARAIDGKIPEELSTAELGRIVNSPTSQSSVPFQRSASYLYARRQLPDEFVNGGSDDAVTRVMGAPKEFTKVVRDITQRNQRGFLNSVQAAKDAAAKAKAAGGTEQPASPAYDERALPLRGTNKLGLFVKTVMDNPQWTASAQTMRDIWTQLRYARKDLAPGEFNMTDADMARMQSALDRDQMNVFQRNIGNFQRTPAKKFDVTFGGRKATLTGKEMAAQYQKAYDGFLNADQITRDTAEHIEALERLYGKPSDESLAKAIRDDFSESGKGNIARAKLMLEDTLSPEEADNVRSGVFRSLWEPKPSARGIQESTGFSAQTFTTNWRGLSDAGRELLTQSKPSLKQAVDDFVRISDRWANVEALRNTSKSATTAWGIGGVIGTMASVGKMFTGDFGAIASGAGTAAMTYGLAQFLSRPAYTRWLTRAVELSGKGGSPFSLRDHVNTLARIVRQQRDPQAKAVGLAAVKAFQEQIAARSPGIAGAASNAQNRDKRLPPLAIRQRLLPAPSNTPAGMPAQ
jgi:hypothetical protein